MISVVRKSFVYNVHNCFLVCVDREKVRVL